MSIPEEQQKGEIVVPKELAKPTRMILDLAEVKEWYRSFNEFKESVIMSNANFYADINIRGKTKRLINRSGWRAIGQAFHLDDDIKKREIIMHPDGKNFTVIIEVRVWHPATGRSVDSIGACSTDEPAKGWAPTYHNVLAIAHTRAKNRGISDICGSGEPSSDEFIAEAEAPTPEELAAREKAKNLPNLKYGCPHCEQNFVTTAELELHVHRDHPTKAAYPARRVA